ncbi:8413_t:CDS:2, partial [Ambispora gerdemannii]
AKKFQAAIGSTFLITAEAIASYFQVYWFGKWVGRNTKSIHSNLEKISTSMRVDAREMERFWQGKDKSPTKSELQRKKEKINEQEKLLYKENLIDQNTWNVTQFANMSVVIQYATTELEADIDDASKENESESRSLELKTTGSIDEKQWFKTKLQRFVVELVISSSLESYLHQKDTNGHAQNEFKLSQRRGPKNKRKNWLMPEESIQLRDTILNKPYHKVQINKIIGNSKVIVDITFGNGSIEQCIIQLADIIGYIDGPMKKQIISSFKDSYGNVVIPTMSYREKKGELQLICTCPVDTSLTLIQSVFLTYKNIHKHAVTFAEADPNSQTKTEALELPESNYFETCLKYWQEPYIVACGSKFKTTDGEVPKNISVNVFEIDECISVETGETNIIDEGMYLQNKDLLEKISFSLEDQATTQK